MICHRNGRFLRCLNSPHVLCMLDHRISALRKYKTRIRHGSRVIVSNDLSLVDPLFMLNLFFHRCNGEKVHKHVYVFMYYCTVCKVFLVSI